ncbi:unnamed protein product [Ascophyllum nodosum]
MLGRVNVDLTVRQGLSARVCFCVRDTKRRFSAAVGQSKGDGNWSWQTKLKIAGGVVATVAVPWLGSVAIANDPETRDAAAMISPGLVGWLRRRRGGNFWDEDKKRLEYLAHAEDWMNKPVTMEVRTPEGESRRLRDLDAGMSFTSVGQMVQGEEGTARAKGDGNRALWLTDFEVLDEGDDGTGKETSAARQQGSGSTWNSSSLTTSTVDFSPSPFAPFSAVSNALRRDIGDCNIRSWWDIAAQESETQQSKAAPSGRGAASSAVRPCEIFVFGRGRRGLRPRSSKSWQEADQARAMDEQLSRMIDALEEDKRTGARSVDDVKEEVRGLRKQQRELRRKHRRRFLGLF